MEDNEIVSFGSVTVPKSWDDITLDKFQKIEKYYEDKDRIFKYVSDDAFVYFVHSYYAADCDDYVTSVAEYGGILTASAENGNVYGMQFHPEKSGEKGLKILKAFCEME